MRLVRALGAIAFVGGLALVTAGEVDADIDGRRGAKTAEGTALAIAGLAVFVVAQAMSR